MKASDLRFEMLCRAANAYSDAVAETERLRSADLEEYSRAEAQGEARKILGEVAIEYARTIEAERVKEAKEAAAASKPPRAPRKPRAPKQVELVKPIDPDAPLGRDANGVPLTEEDFAGANGAAE